MFKNNLGIFCYPGAMRPISNDCLRVCLLSVYGFNLLWKENPPNLEQTQILSKSSLWDRKWTNLGDSLYFTIVVARASGLPLFFSFFEPKYIYTFNPHEAYIISRVK